MKVSIIAAVAENNVIGNSRKIPWHIPEDMSHFKKITTGHHVVMGRKTYESIGRPLPQRTNLILSADEGHQIEGCYLFQNLHEAVAFAKKNGEEELMVIGGEQIYRLALPIVERIYLTLILAKFEGNVFFPEINPEEWEEISHELHLTNEVPFEFKTLERRG